MSDNGNQRRKPDLRTAVEDLKTLVTVLIERLSKLSPAALFAIGVVGTLVLAAVVVIALLSTSDAQAVSHNAPLIAAVIALGGVGTAQMVSIALEDRRTQEARNLEAHRAGEAALQNYFKQVGELVIEKTLREASPADNLSTVVRAQTLSVLEGLDPERKRILLLFLYESGLIDKTKPVVSLAAANLRDANLRGVNMRDVNLRDANLRGVNLIRADLCGADLLKANLGRGNLSGALLEYADLSGAALIEVNLSGAFLLTTNLSGALLYEAALIRADLRNTNLSGALLEYADLSEAALMEANLSGALLRGAFLRGAFLDGANLSGAMGVTNEQLSVANSLEGATMPDRQTLRGSEMPNGPTFEDWLKSKGSGKD